VSVLPSEAFLDLRSFSEGGSEGGSGGSSEGGSEGF